jgi:carboxyl-terminal processing protease
MRGAPGTPIKLKIVRPGRDKPFDVAMIRERIQLRPVKWEIKDGIGYIDINTFSGNAAEATEAALTAIDKATGRLGTALGPVEVQLQHRGRPVSAAIIAGSSALLSKDLKSR